MRCRQKNLDCTYDRDVSPATSLQNGSSEAAHVHDPAQTGTMQPTRGAITSHGITVSDDNFSGDHESLSWLHSDQLPDGEQIRMLVESYFAHVHPLRAFGFIHKPSFMQRLDAGLASNESENALLYIM